MSHGFSHGFGRLPANRALVAWMHTYNETRGPDERLTIHGFDAPTEMASAPSPRSHLEHVRDYLAADIDLDPLLGDDERWSRTEAVMDAQMSVGATTEAITLRSLADDLLATLYAHAPQLVAQTSRSAWHTAKVHAKAAVGLLRYHHQAAQPLEPAARWSGLLATRDAIMAQNLLDIRATEAPRGPTLVFAQNLHLQRNQSSWQLAGMDLNWSCAGAIVASLLGGRYAFAAGSLGASTTLELAEPMPGTHESSLQQHVTDWGLLAPKAVPEHGGPRQDVTVEQGYFPLDRPTIDSADAILHVTDGPAAAESAQQAFPTPGKDAGT